MLRYDYDYVTVVAVCLMRQAVVDSFFPYTYQVES